MPAFTDDQNQLVSIKPCWTTRYADWDSLEDKMIAESIMDRLDNIRISLGPGAETWAILGSQVSVERQRARLRDCLQEIEKIYQ